MVRMLKSVREESPSNDPTLALGREHLLEASALRGGARRDTLRYPETSTVRSSTFHQQTTEQLQLTADVSAVVTCGARLRPWAKATARDLSRRVLLEWRVVAS